MTTNLSYRAYIGAVPVLNRLAGEASAYLRQHAANPVGWWPWCEDAFSEAKARDLPVLISVGYSACHWCHVMAHESFEDPEVADVLNANFVAIKVDREERPDIDAVYMEAVQLVNGSGGWPMTVLVTPDERPFWAGTYLPKHSFLHLLGEVSRIWSSDREGVELDATRLTEAVRQGASLPPVAMVAGALTGTAAGVATLASNGAGPGRGASAGESPGLLPRSVPDVLGIAAEALVSRQDPEWGGLAGTPKFPQPPSLEVLARYSWRTKSPSAMAALRRQLDAMSSGGIYDHLGGGFARYSTDRRWLVPHFEKMLYDNALLTLAYTYAWQLTGYHRYRQVVEETVGYLLSPPARLEEGAWASAEDADSEGKEGRFYTWSREEVEQVAGHDVADWYGVTARGNWEGTNILWRPGLADLERPEDIEEGRRRLFERRSGRPRPGLDGKVLTEWNAMAIAALAYAGRALDRPGWVAAAEETGEVLLAHLRRPDGRWLRSWVPGGGARTRAAGARAGAGGAASAAAGTARHLAYAGDYAWLVEAFGRLSEATGRRSWVEEAQAAARALVELFWDEQLGGFFTYGNDGEVLLARMKDIHDGAVPSANSVAAGALARLGELTGEASFSETAFQTLQMIAPVLERAPSAFPAMALVADYMREPRRQVVVASSAHQDVRPVWDRYLPDTVLAWGEPFPSLLWEGRDSASNAGLSFVCEGFACRLPTSGPQALATALDRPAA